MAAARKKTQPKPEPKPGKLPDPPDEEGVEIVDALADTVFTLRQAGLPPQDSREPLAMAKAALEAAADLQAAQFLVAEVLELDEKTPAPASLVSAFFQELGRRRRTVQERLRYADGKTGN